MSNIETHIFRLKNQVKHYDWGSLVWIPDLLGLENRDGRPWAELWMGVHPGGPSETDYGGKPILLPELAERTGCRLPFLFKLLAAEKPHSIQAHPSLAQAAEGFARENTAGIALQAPERNYKDPNHKPEILCALGPFKALCGFRRPDEILLLLNTLSPDTASLQNTLASLSDPLLRGFGLRAFLEALFALSPAALLDLSEHIRCIGRETEVWDLCATLAEAYPGDPGLLAPLYLNLVSLQAGEAIYVPAGVLHAYIKGFGVELMANSDNVLRGGLTAKYMDTGELFRILDFSPFKPALLRPEGLRYDVPCTDFALWVLEKRGGADCLSRTGPVIVIVIRGRVNITINEEISTLSQGESAFLLPAGKILFSGDFTLYAAEAPLAGKGAGTSDENSG
jgi:mannose-6-phosphate isomerase